MERLTFEGNFCDIAQCYHLPCPYDGSCSQKQVWERLRAYEDTGMKPEEITAMQHTLAEYRKEADLLLKAQADGRVIVLPAKVGDAYYTIESFCTEDGHDDEKKLHHTWDCECCNTKNCDVERRVVGKTFQSEKDLFYKRAWIGLCAWLTREEAENALRRTGNG